MSALLGVALGLACTKQPPEHYDSDGVVPNADSGDADTDADSDSDTDADSDADSDSDADTDVPLRFTEIGADAAHACALDAEGYASCWGFDYDTDFTPPTVPIHGLTVGGDFACGLQADSTPICWGSDSSGSVSAAPTVALETLSAGRTQVCGLTSKGELECWGQNLWNMVEGRPDGLFAQVSCGEHLCCVLDAEGLATCWGDEGDDPPDYRPVKDALPGPFDLIAAGWYHGCGVRDGTTQCWGRNDAGQAMPPEVSLVQLDLTTIHSCGVTDSGELACWGCDADCSYDFGQVTDTPTEGEWIKVATGGVFSCALDASGAIECWGRNELGQLDHP